METRTAAHDAGVGRLLLNLPIEEWKLERRWRGDVAPILLNLPIEEWKQEGVFTHAQHLRLLNLPIEEWKRRARAPCSRTRRRS